jgi:WD40 repeat protein
MTAASTLTGIAHNDTVNNLLQISQTCVASASNDKTLKVWNMNTNSLVNSYYGQTAQVNTLALWANNQVAAGGNDSRIWLWDMSGGNANYSYITLTAPIYTLKMHPMYSNLMAINTFNSIILYKMVSGSYIVNKTITTSRTYSDMDILLPSGNVIATGPYTDVYLFSNGTRYYTLTNSVNGCKIKQLPDNKTVVVGRTDGKMSLFNSNTSTQGSNYSVHTGAIVMLQVTPDLLYLVSGGSDNKLVLWTWALMSLTQVNTYAVSVSGMVKSGVLITPTYTQSNKTNFFFKGSAYLCTNCQIAKYCKLQNAQIAKFMAKLAPYVSTRIPEIFF